MSEGKSTDAFLGFLLGAAAGAVAALLLAPRSGEQTRRRITDWLEDNRDKTKEFLEKEREKIQHTKERIGSAVEAAKTAYRETN